VAGRLDIWWLPWSIIASIETVSGVVELDEKRCEVEKKRKHGWFLCLEVYFIYP
jgi:hypothetical protein